MREGKSVADVDTVVFLFGNIEKVHSATVRETSAMTT